MKSQTATAALTDFCLVVTATRDAAGQASVAVRTRFTFLAEETRTKLVAVVAELVQKTVEEGSGNPITVTIALEPDAIHGEVSDQGDRFPFRIFLGAYPVRPSEPGA